MIKEEWLINTNKKFSQEDVPHRKRAFKAVEKFSTENNIPITIGSDISNIIFKWFENNTKKGTQTVGSMYDFVYYFDGEFWKAKIPLLYGKNDINPLEYIEIRSSLKKELISNNLYSNHFKNCYNFIYRLDKAIENIKYNKLGLDYLTAGVEELKSSISLLNEEKTNPRSIMNSRMAIEMFFKAYLVIKHDFTEKKATKIGHDLKKGFNKIIELSGKIEISIEEKIFDIFPDIRYRYNEQKHSNTTLWEAYKLAQNIGTLVVEKLSK